MWGGVVGTILLKGCAVPKGSAGCEDHPSSMQVHNIRVEQRPRAHLQPAFVQLEIVHRGLLERCVKQQENLLQHLMLGVQQALGIW